MSETNVNMYPKLSNEVQFRLKDPIRAWISKFSEKPIFGQGKPQSNWNSSVKKNWKSLFVLGILGISEKVENFLLTQFSTTSFEWLKFGNLSPKRNLKTATVTEIKN